MSNFPVIRAKPLDVIGPLKDMIHLERDTAIHGILVEHVNLGWLEQFTLKSGDVYFYIYKTSTKDIKRCMFLLHKEVDLIMED